MDDDEFPAAALAWRDQAVGRRFGAIFVEAANLRWESAINGDAATVLDLILSPPADGAETWPIDDILDMRRALYADARRLGVDPPWFTPVLSADELDDEPADDEEPWPLDSARDGAA